MQHVASAQLPADCTGHLSSSYSLQPLLQQPTVALLLLTPPCLQSSLDYVVAMELWWRTAALQAFLAIVAGPLASAPRADQPRLFQRAAALLKPTLDVLVAHAALQVGWL